MRVPRHARKVAAITGAVALTVLLGSCSTQSDSSNSESITLHYAYWDSNQKAATDDVIAAFERNNPGITVEADLSGWDAYWTKLQTSIAGGSGPDVFWMNGPNFQLYAANGQLAELPNLDTSAYPPGLVDLYSLSGRQYGAPKDFDTIGVWYNKNLFDAAGVAYPQDGWTWDDYLETARRLTDPEAGVWGSAAVLNTQSNFYDTIIQAGGEVISADGTKTGYGSDAAVAGIEFWVTQLAEGLSPTQQQMTDTAPIDLFTSGKIAMFWNGSWAAGTFHDNANFSTQVDVAPMPSGPAGNAGVIHGVANVVNAKSKHLDAARTFAEFASGREASEIVAAHGAVIPAYNGMQNTWVEAIPEYNLSVFTDAVATAVPYPTSRNTSAWNNLEYEMLTPVWTLSVSPSEGLAKLAKAVQTALDDED